MFKTITKSFLTAILLIQLVLTGPFAYASKNNQDLYGKGQSIKEKIRSKKKDKSSPNYVLDTTGIYKQNPLYVSRPQNATEKSLADSYIEAEKNLNKVSPIASERSLVPYQTEAEREATQSRLPSPYRVSKDDLEEARIKARENNQKNGPLTRMALNARYSIGGEARKILTEQNEIFKKWSQKLKAESFGAPQYEGQKPMVEYYSSELDTVYQLKRTPRALMTLFTPQVQESITREFEKNLTQIDKISLSNTAQAWKASFLSVSKRVLGNKYQTFASTLEEMAEGSKRAAVTSLRASNNLSQKAIVGGFKFLKIWTVETLFFNTAGAIAGFTQAGFDASFNPLHFQAWQDAWGDPVGHLGFGAFIAANHGYQALLSKLPPSAAVGFLKSLGMGVGASASHLVHSWLHHPAWKAYWSTLGLENNPDPEIAAKAREIQMHASAVMMYEFTSWRFWRSQVDDIGALFAASWIANGVLGVTIGTAKLGAKGAKAAKSSIVKNAKFTSTHGSVSLQKAAKAAKNLQQTRFLVAMKDLGGAFKVLVPGASLFKLTHFTVFLLADPLARMLLTPATKNLEVAYTKVYLDRFNKLHEERYPLLNTPVLLDRRTETVELLPNSIKPTPYSAANKAMAPMSHKTNSPLESFYYSVKSYYEGKKEHRALVTSNIEADRANWKDYMSRFRSDEEMGALVYKRIYSALTDKFIEKWRENMNSDQTRGKLPLGSDLVEKDIRNDFVPDFYYSLPKDSQDLVYNNISNLAIMNEKIGKQFFNSLQMDLIRSFTENQDVVWSRSLLSGSFRNNEMVFWNKALELPLYGMLMGPDPKSEKVFDIDSGEYPKFRPPRLIDRDLNPEVLGSIGYIDVEAKKSPLTTKFQHNGAQINLYEFLGTEYKDDKDGKFKNALEFIYDNLSPELKLGLDPQSGEPVVPNFEHWYEYYVSCRPNKSFQDFLNSFDRTEELKARFSQISTSDLDEETKILQKREIDEEIKSLIPQCGTGSINYAYEKYFEIYQNFLLNKVGNIYGKTDVHQKDSVMNTLIDAIPLLNESFLEVKAQDRFSQTIHNLEDISIGHNNPLVSVIEDIVVSKKILKKIFSKNLGKNQQLGKKEAEFLTQLDKLYLELLNESINSIVSTTATDAIAAEENFNYIVDEMVSNINNYSCENLQKLNTKNTFEVQIAQGKNAKFRYEQVYNHNTKKYDLDFYQLAAGDSCQTDQIREKHVFFEAEPHPKGDLDLGHPTTSLPAPNSANSAALLERFSVAALKSEFPKDEDVLGFLMAQVSQEANVAAQSKENLKKFIAPYNASAYLQESLSILDRHVEPLGYVLKDLPEDNALADNHSNKIGLAYASGNILAGKKYHEEQIKQYGNSYGSEGSSLPNDPIRVPYRSTDKSEYSKKEEAILAALSSTIKDPNAYGDIRLHKLNPQSYKVKLSSRMAIASLVVSNLRRLMKDELNPVYSVNLREYLAAKNTQLQEKWAKVDINKQISSEAPKLQSKTLDEFCSLGKVLSDSILLNRSDDAVLLASSQVQKLLDIENEPHKYNPQDVDAAIEKLNALQELAESPEISALVATQAVELLSAYEPTGYCKQENTPKNTNLFHRLLDKVNEAWSKDQ